MFLEQPTPKKKRKAFKDYFDFRNTQMNQVGLILFSAFVISTSLIWFMEERFIEERWKQSPMQRHEMVNDILDRELFINDTKNEIIDKLGQPDESFINETDYYVYSVGKHISLNGQEAQIVLIFENNSVTKVILAPNED